FPYPTLFRSTMLDPVHAGGAGAGPPCRGPRSRPQFRFIQMRVVFQYSGARRPASVQCHGPMQLRAHEAAFAQIGLAQIGIREIGVAQRSMREYGAAAAGSM